MRYDSEKLIKNFFFLQEIWPTHTAFEDFPGRHPMFGIPYLSSSISTATREFLKLELLQE